MRNDPGIVTNYRNYKKRNLSAFQGMARNDLVREVYKIH